MCLENILFVSKSLKKLTPSVFRTWFSFSSDKHNYGISSSAQGNLAKLICNTNKYGKYSITVSAVELWKKSKNNLKIFNLKIYPPGKLNQFFVIFILNHINTY